MILKPVCDHGHRRHLLVTATALALTLSLCPQASAFFDKILNQFKNDKETTRESPEVGSAESSPLVDDDIAAEMLAMREPRMCRQKPDRSLLIQAVREQEMISKNLNIAPPGAENNAVAAYVRHGKPETLTKSEPESSFGSESEITDQDSHSDDYDEEFDDEAATVSRLEARLEALKKKNINVDKFLVNIKEQPEDAEDRDSLRPALVIQNSKKNKTNSKISSMFSKKNLKKTVKKAVKSTSTGLTYVGEALVAIPDGIAKVRGLKILDKCAKLIPAIESTEVEARRVREDFSKFSIDWEHMMTKSLNYLGLEGIENIKRTSEDNLIFEFDALMVLTFGYELVRFLIVWYENLLVAHEAQKLYLETVLDNCNHDAKFIVDERLMVALNSRYNYLLFSSWESIKVTITEPRMKLDYLMSMQDESVKNYESEYFRMATKMQEIYEPTRNSFETAWQEVSAKVAKAGFEPDVIDSIDASFNSFRDKVASKQIKNVLWEAPKELMDFINLLTPKLKYHKRIYNNEFLRELKSVKNSVANNQMIY